MLLLGLTGSIATGKSTVSSYLSSTHDLPIIDADLLARSVVEPGTSGYRQILSAFSASTPGLVGIAGGPLNRGVLGKRVFGDSPERVRDRHVLNGIIHPLVRREIAREVVKAWWSGAWAVVLDVPLLLEARLESVCGAVVVVGVGEECQLQRLMRRDGSTEEEARKRVKSQWSVEEKVALAKGVFGERAWVVQNEGTVEELKLQVDQVVREIRRGRVGPWRWVWGNPIVGVLLGTWMVALNWWRRRQWEAKTREGKAKL
ncbi:dephospho-CoA kinase-domain-containing protein [Tricharina praecox]|uniref:dephospho-CoA kinase-domain-containing protein n=1 Tax=Tricharina praecox TaxID=43433 RepID=UPI00221FEDB5|nr:dephospho-CoA kinase-domain-containing protein [Tricharina praecox]KAI5854210.1 dephospho-CoA kinase-domain-containing protein [Tricharina praecox]